MNDDCYDPMWVPDEGRELELAAQRLEEFRPGADISPRRAFLLARWLRSYAAEITEKARQLRHTPDVDENALELARDINEENTTRG
ncbi:hypothetical protein [Nonomuraea basaltis]|uniref:hypothetical protein n=1 Tax=Nonomuraea basaltis TaxID=2495887 RepID=UPI00110C5902|nr:hypothetical protein [Nonomuraea basaltis]TMR90513.1 hypothetical protein EJK15_55015 [Nonomuraea basaltis]